MIESNRLNERFCFYFYAKDGPDWKPLRKLMNPLFSSKVIQSFVSIFNEKSFELVEKLSERVGESNVDITQYMFACTLDMACCRLLIFVLLDIIVSQVFFVLASTLGSELNIPSDVTEAYRKSFHL